MCSKETTWISRVGYQCLDCLFKDVSELFIPVIFWIIYLPETGRTKNFNTMMILWLALNRDPTDARLSY